MKYLVLRRFWSYGKLLEKGTVVDESEIRSPNLRRSEGKITPAVSSLEVPAEFGAEDTSSQVLLEEDNDTSAEVAKDITENAETVGEGKEVTSDEAGEETKQPKLFKLAVKKG
jgi:hypothetical protein